MGYTHELYESRFVDIYWDSSPHVWFVLDKWPCGCIWIKCGWLLINITYRKHDPKARF